MADQLQKQFEAFHETMKLKRFDENKDLREKRDKILDALTRGLEKLFEDENESRPKYAWFNQGSYAMGTGVKCLDKADDYDIDVGLRFHVSKDEYEDATDLKSLVFDALNGHTKEVTIMRPCVRVNYVGEYHVDLAVYASAESNDGTNYLSKGVPGSADDKKEWEGSDPEGLITYVADRWSGDDALQFRRIVRYLKRWKDYRFSSTGNAAPVGIGLTISALRAFHPRYENTISGKKPRDLLALRNVVVAMCDQFSLRYHGAEGLGRRLTADLPVLPYSDVYDRMSNKQMATFEEKLKALRIALDAAISEPDPHDAATTLAAEFGSDFPIPEKEDTAQKSSRPAWTTTSSSA